MQSIILWRVKLQQCRWANGVGKRTADELQKEATYPGWILYFEAMVTGNELRACKDKDIYQ